MTLLRSLLSLIGKENQIKLALLQILFLISAFLQVAGIASIAPFITLINDLTSIETNTILSFLHSSYDFDSTKQFVVAYAGFVVILLVIGNVISSYALWRLFKTSMSVGADIQRTVYQSYLDNDFTFFAMNNSSHLISTVTQEIPRMVYMVIQPILTMISQIFIATLIISALLLVDIEIALIATLIVCASYFLIFRIVRSQVVQKGKTITLLNSKKLRYLNESIAGIKEVKLKGNESYYKKKVDEITRAGLSALAYIELAGDLPKFVVETVVFSAILGLSIYIVLISGTAGDALSIISLYAIAGYKLLPAAQQIYKSFSAIRANASVVSEIHDEIRRSKTFNNQLKDPGTEVIPESDIEFRDVGFSYPGGKSPALQNCSFVIERNAITAFVGPSGAGKSTAVDILLGLLVPDHGEVKIGTKTLEKRNIRSWRQKIGYVAQDIFILDASFRENIAFGVPPEEIDDDQVIRAAKLADIYDFIFECEGQLEFNLGERGARLSGGQKQRIGIARALYENPSILIFDEATSALDNVTERNIMRDIVNLAKSHTVVMIAHRLTTVEQAQNILVFNGGKVEAGGSYDELAHKSQTFRRLIDANTADEPIEDGSGQCKTP
ncbi:ABC-type multidrug transport system, ATPase and permease component [Marinobacter sp. es.042]|uniref:ABC transporter ATP-binding protein n=1 Tax=Marinobacter sp. es.042 TaxID=1761794 RepID=UPI000B50489E|nr:ABC transporter ATP-binding protein [Marinobacter sp. es.042]SNB55502.1 ABC-type multidrug transport system, ATPase and permease component [Marinobacter sp. es.042]